MKYLSAWFYMLAIALLLLTVVVLGIYWVIYSRSFFLKALGAVYITLALFLMTDRDVFLPFLGETVFPKALLEPRVPKEATETIRVPMKGLADGTPVVYWAAEPSEKIIEDPWKAYSNYENAGVALVLLDSVEFKVRSPAAYRVPSGRELKRHVHYRVLQNNGMLGSVETVYV
jgi:hypothetical protein